MKPAIATLSALALLGSLSAQNIIGVNFAGDAYVIDPASGTETLIGPTGFTNLNSLANVDDVLVTIDGGGALIQIDPLTGAGTQIGITNPLLDSVRGLASDANGVLYAIENGGGTSVVDKLYTIDIGTGATTLIGDTIPYSGLQGLTFRNNTLLSWDVGNGSGIGSGAGLVTIDVANGVATDVSAVNGNDVELQCLSTNPLTNEVFGGNDLMYTINVANGVATEITTSSLTDMRGMELYLQRATCVERNGVGVNPVACSCVTTPTFGTSWQINVDVAPNGLSTFLLVSQVALSAAIVVPGFGEVLVIDPIAIGAANGQYSIAIPNDPGLLDFPLSAQGLQINDNSGNLQFVLTNAVDGQLGY